MLSCQEIPSSRHQPQWPAHPSPPLDEPNLAGHQHPWEQRPVPRARHRPHGRVEDTIRNGKQTGLGHLPLRLLRHQPGLMHCCCYRLRPAVLVSAAVPGRTPDQGRTQDPAVPATEHRRPHHPRPTQTHNPHPRDLALGRPTRHLSDRRARAAATDPMLINHAPVPDSKTTPGPVEPGAHLTRQPGSESASHFDNNINNKLKINI